MTKLGLALILGLAACGGGGSGETICKESSSRLTNDCATKSIPMQLTATDCSDALSQCVATCYLNYSCMDITADMAGGTNNAVPTCIAACKPGNDMTDLADLGMGDLPIQLDLTVITPADLTTVD